MTGSRLVHHGRCDVPGGDDVRRVGRWAPREPDDGVCPWAAPGAPRRVAALGVGAPCGALGVFLYLVGADQSVAGQGRPGPAGAYGVVAGPEAFDGGGVRHVRAPAA